MALTSQRANPPERWTKRRLEMAAGVTAYKGGACGIETASNANQGQVVPMSVSTTLLYIGIFAQNLASSASAQLVDVELLEEIDLRWYANAAAPNAVTNLQRGALCYFVDDYTVSKTSTSNSLAGRVWAVDSARGVAVQKLGQGSIIVGAAGDVAEANITPEYLAINATNDVTIVVADGLERQITACGDGKAITVDDLGAVAGMKIAIWRPAIGATTGCTIVNGGAGGGTLATFTSNKAAGVVLAFDGTNWGVVSLYQAA